MSKKPILIYDEEPLDIPSVNWKEAYVGEHRRYLELIHHNNNLIEENQIQRSRAIFFILTTVLLAIALSLVLGYMGAEQVAEMVRRLGG